MDAEYIAYFQKEISDLKDEIKSYKSKLDIAIKVLNEIKSNDDTWKGYINRMLNKLRRPNNDVLHHD